MLRSLAAILLLLTLSLVAWSGGGEGIQGVWLPVTAEIGAKPFPEQLRKTIKLVVDGDKYTVTVGGMTDQGTVMLNMAVKPHEMDIIAGDGANKGKTILAIYKRDGDTLTVCYDVSGTGRPKEFKTKEGAPHFLVTYKRDK